MKNTSKTSKDPVSRKTVFRQGKIRAAWLPNFLLNFLLAVTLIVAVSPGPTALAYADEPQGADGAFAYEGSTASGSSGEEEQENQTEGHVVPLDDTGWDAAPQASEVIYTQAEGFEPYQGWQDAPWDQGADPYYNNGSGGTSRKGWPAWSLSDPLSKGVTGFKLGATDYAAGVSTGTEVTVVTDTKLVNTSGVGDYYDPYYYKNVILPSYDVSNATISFTFNYVGAGGVVAASELGSGLYDKAGGILISTSPDPEDWTAEESIVWTGTSANTAIHATSDNWWKNVVFTVGTEKLEPNQTYYFVIKNGTAGYHGRLFADIVFEFSTDTNRAAVWQGDESNVAYGREQGNGGTKLGIMNPAPAVIKTDLTKLDAAWYNKITSALSLDDEGKVNLAVHADGSGSNWQVISDWSAQRVSVYDTDPVSGGSFETSGLTPVASSQMEGGIAFSLVNSERDWPSFDGVNIAIDNLEAGRTYYLVFPGEFKPGNNTRAISKPIVVEFSTTAPEPADVWDISTTQDGSLTANLIPAENDTFELRLEGTGAMRDFALAADVPWAGSKESIASLSLSEGLTSVGAYAFSGLNNSAFTLVKLPSTIETIGVEAFANCANLWAIDLTACTTGSTPKLTSIGNGAFWRGDRGSTVYLSDQAAISLITKSTSIATANVQQQYTAIAVTNGGSIVRDAVISKEAYAPLVNQEQVFTGWYNEATLTNAGTWAHIGGSGNIRYAGWASSIDKSALLASISEATNDLGTVVVSIDGTDIEPANKWVTQQAMAAFENDIFAAQAIYDDPDATQQEVNSAVSVLDGAKNAFDTEKQNGRTATETISLDDEAEFRAFATAVNGGDDYASKTVVLTTDIDLSSANWVPIGNSGTVSFKGVFDGQSHLISNMVVEGDSTTATHAGLFGNVNGGVVKNIQLVDSRVTGGLYASGVVAYLTGAAAVVVNCSSAATVSSDDAYAVGGVVSYLYTGARVANSSNSSSISGKQSVGGVVGYAYNAGVSERLSNSGTVTYTGNKGDHGCGGIAGFFLGTYLVQAVNTGTVNNDGGAAYAGGVVGFLTGNSSCSDVYNTGSVTTNENYESGSRTGGVTGRIYNSSLTNCYNIGEVSGVGTLGAVLGGIVNAGDALQATGLSYLDSAFTAEDTYATAKTAEEMATADTFAGFDFDSVWAIGVVEDYTYPTLQSVPMVWPEDPSGSYTVDYSMYDPYAGNQGATVGGRDGNESFSLTLVNPLSQGVTTSTGATSDKVTVVNDPSRYIADAEDGSTPAYFYNLIVDSYDVTQDTTFAFDFYGPGGNWVSAAVNSAYVHVYNTPDKSAWDETTCVWSASAENTTASNTLSWTGLYTSTIPANTLEDGQTYYFVVTHGINTSQGSRYLNADVVFEFSTDLNKIPDLVGSGEGDKITAYAGLQGVASKVTVVDPPAAKITTNYTKGITYNYWHNLIDGSVVYNPASPISFDVELEGGGSKHQNETTWQDNNLPYIKVYSEPTYTEAVDETPARVTFAQEDLVAAWDEGEGLIRFSGTYVSGSAVTATIPSFTLLANTTYYFVVEPGFSVTAPAIDGIGKYAVFEFTTAEAEVDTTELEAAIAEATADLNDTVVSTDGSDIPGASKWVVESVKNAFAEAIAAAQAVYDNNDATLAEIETSLSTLAAAKGDFDNAKAYGTKPDSAEFKLAITTPADSTIFRLPISGNPYGKAYDWKVAWGDGGVEELSGNGSLGGGIPHTYSTAGDYVITITPMGSTEAWLAPFGFYIGTSGANTVANKAMVTGVLSPLTPSMKRTNVQITGEEAAPANEWYYTFYGCTNLVVAPTLANWEAVTTVGANFFSYLFYGCTHLASLPEDFNLPQNITQAGNSFAYYMFYDCKALTSLPEGFNLPQNISQVGNSFAHNMFVRSALTSLPEGFNLPQNITQAGNSFAQSMLSGLALTSLPEGFNLPQNITQVGDSFASFMFSGCTVLTSLPTGFNLPQNITQVGISFAQNMFAGCTTLTSLPEGFNLPQNISQAGNTFANQMFNTCAALTTLPTGFNLPQNITQVGTNFAGSMFSGCTALTSLPEGFNLPQNIITFATGFAQMMFSNAGSATFQINPEFTFPTGAQTNLNNVFSKTFDLADTAPAQTRSATSIIKSCATPTNQRNTFDEHFVDQSYIAINWGGQGLERPTSWDVSAAQDDSLMASVALNEDFITYTLNFTCSEEGSGVMMNFTSASGAPWFAEYGAVITNAVVGDGIMSMGEYALGLENLATVKGGDALSVIGNNALSGAYNLVAVDLSGCTLTGVFDSSFGNQQGQMLTQRTIYVKDNASATHVVESYTSGGNTKTAVAVVNGGAFSEEAVFESGVLAEPEQEGHTFAGWRSDEALMHPANTWKPISTGAIFYARFVESGGPIDEGEEYPGNQGLDQAVTLLDLSRLPGATYKHPGVLYYGEDETRYDNRIAEPYNGYNDLVFAFNMRRGNNANGGDGTYQKVFSLPYIFILDSEGNTVASYDNGNGNLMLFSTVFDGVDGKTQGNTVWAFRIGVEAQGLEAGSYTLRFSKDLGANNGVSFLGMHVDFQFAVAYPEQYTFITQEVDGELAITGITIDSSVQDALDIVIPSQIDGKAVVAIDDTAFSGESKIGSITIPASVESIGSEAFSDLPRLAWVKDLSTSSELPLWGEDVFDGSDALDIIYGYSSATTVVDIADEYASQGVLFHPLEDGVYVDGVLITDGGTIALSATDPDATVRIFRDGEEITSEYCGFITNANVATHPSMAAREWNAITGKANGEAALVIRTISGDDYLSLKLSGSDFSKDASTERETLTSPQGNGSTIALIGAGTIKTITYDETKDYFDNYLVDSVVAVGTMFNLEIAGPGSAWDETRWDWDDWTENHLNEYLSLRNADTGETVATMGRGLFWITLTNRNTLSLGVDTGILIPGNIYTLVAGKELTGHNVAAALQKDVRWTFTAAAADISACTIATIDPQVYTGEEREPVLTVSWPTPAITLWDEAAEQAVVVAEPATQTLVQGVDYTVSYSENTEIGMATATVAGTGSFTGTKDAPFEIWSGDLEDLTITIAANSARRAYDGTPLTLGTSAYTVTGAPAGFAVNATTSGAELTNVGSAANRVLDGYTVMLGEEDITDAVTVSTAEGTLEVTPRPASVTAAYAWKYYGSADPTLLAVHAGFIGSDAPTPAQYRVTRPGVGIDEAVGVYTNVLVVSNVSFNNPNYEVSWSTGTFEITSLPAAAPTGAGETTVPPEYLVISPAYGELIDNRPTTSATQDDDRSSTPSTPRTPTQESDELTDIEEEETPLVGEEPISNPLSVVNLLLVAASVIAAIGLLITFLTARRREQNSERQILGGIIRCATSLIAAVTTVVLCVATATFVPNLTAVDGWTIWHALILVVQLILTAIAFYTHRKNTREGNTFSDLGQTQT